MVQFPKIGIANDVQILTNLKAYSLSEHDYIRTIRAYDEELQKLRIKVKQQWQNT